MANTTIEAIIQKIKQSVANTYAVLFAMGADTPAEENSDNLASTAGTVKVIRYDEQTLTDAQKSQAKSNIGLNNVDNVKQYSASNPPPYPVTKVNGKTGDVSLKASDVGALPDTTNIPTVPTKVSAFTNDAGYLTSFTETDPTVPAWAKSASKPTYTKSEVGLGNVDNVKQYSASNPPPYPVTSVNGKTGAVSLTIPTVPTNVSAFTNDAGYLKSFTETDPTVPAWAKEESPPTYSKSDVGLGNVDNVKQYSASNPPPYPVTSVNSKTGVVSLVASDVGADASGTASSAVSTHNGSSSAHSTQFAAKLDKAGGTMTGALKAQNNTNYTTAQVRNVIYLPEGSDMPTLGLGEECWFYEVVE